MKKSHIFSIIIIISSYTNFVLTMEIDPREQEKNFQFSFVLNNITSPYREEERQAHAMLIYLTATGYPPAISFIKQNNLSNQQARPVNVVTHPSPPNYDRHPIAEDLISNILNNKIPMIHPYYLSDIREEAKNGNLKAAYCLQEMGYQVPNGFKELPKK